MRTAPSLYRPRLLWLFIITGMLSACQPAQESAATSSADSAPVASIAHASAQVATAGTNARLPQVLDWTKIDSGVTAVDKNTFDYPFALDSKPVQAYADAYHVDANSARYNLTVGMAVNEVLDKVLDQIGTAYVSHELTAGKTSEFIIHTTPRIEPSRHTYVFAEPFAHGLTIDVIIANDGIKQPMPADTNHRLP